MHREVDNLQYLGSWTGISKEKLEVLTNRILMSGLVANRYPR